MGAWLMKYMGSKRSMLSNTLGALICDHAPRATRIVDLFCGAGSAAWFAAENTMRPVLAVDLQAYAAMLTQAVIGRTEPLDPDEIVTKWLTNTKEDRDASRHWQSARAMEAKIADTKKLVEASRRLCSEPLSPGPVWNAYGGHYFSPTQALTFDYMLKHTPHAEPERSVCLAATISSASECAAAPGHTAQPFQPTPTASAYLRKAWERDPLAACTEALRSICPRHANVIGEVMVADALNVAQNLRPGDLVIVDPPYSEVQYSRFYHVLETVARGWCGPVEGVGRYPPITERPQSNFCRKSQSKRVLHRLIEALAKAQATVIFTFPAGQSSNGLSGDIVLRAAHTWFDVEKMIVNGRFSTLGGNNTDRASRKPSSELLILMQPKHNGANVRPSRAP